MTKWRCHKKGSLKSIRSFERLSQKLFMSEFQYHDSTKWWCHQWLGLNLLKPRSFLCIIPKVSNQVPSYSDHEITDHGLPKWRKTKKWEKIFWITKRDNKGVSNQGKKITNWGRHFKSGQEELQIYVEHLLQLHLRQHPETLLPKKLLGKVIFKPCPHSSEQIALGIVIIGNNFYNCMSIQKFSRKTTPVFYLPPLQTSLLADVFIMFLYYMVIHSPSISNWYRFRNNFINNSFLHSASAGIKKLQYKFK